MARPRKPITYTVNERGCHICTSHTCNDDGYPIVNRAGYKGTLIRYLYEQRFGRLLPGFLIRHTCDQPRCIRLGHILIGTTEDNVDDRVKRERSARGERSGRAKLTTAQVMTIWQSQESITVLARRYGVSLRTITKIKKGENWAWLQLTSQQP